MSGSAIPLYTSSLPVTAPALNSLGNRLALSVQLLSLPEQAPQLQNLTKPLVLSGVPVSLLPSGDLTLQTSLGLFQLAVGKVEDDLFNVLKAAVEKTGSGKALFDFVLQPGTPPETVTLFVPKSEDKQKVGGTPLSPASTPKETAHLTKGQTLELSLLPEKVEEHILASGGETKASVIARSQETTLPRFLARVVGLGTGSENKGTQEAQGMVKSQTMPSAEGGTEKKANLVLQRGSGGPLASSATGQSAYQKIRIDLLLPPAEPWPQEIAPDQIKLHVLGKSLSGQTVVEGEGHVFVVTTQHSHAPAGTKILASLLNPYDMTSPQPFLPKADTTLLQTTEEMMATLTQLDPAAAQNFATTRLPMPQSHLSGTMLFFLAALRSDALEEWIGPSTMARIEGAQKKKVVEAFTQALRESSNVAIDDQSGAWRSWTIPFMNGDAMERVKLYVREDSSRHKAGGVEDKPVYTRFVITMNMSRLGSMQLDGLSQIKKLDMVFRSEKELPQALVNDLRETAMKAFEAVGVAGTLLFQSGRGQWISFKEEPVGVDV